jgi:hypothetical protein
MQVLLHTDPFSFKFMVIRELYKLLYNHTSATREKNK